MRHYGSCALGQFVCVLYLRTFVKGGVNRFFPHTNSTKVYRRKIKRENLQVFSKALRSLQVKHSGNRVHADLGPQAPPHTEGRPQCMCVEERRIGPRAGAYAARASIAGCPTPRRALPIGPAAHCGCARSVHKHTTVARRCLLSF